MAFWSVSSSYEPLREYLWTIDFLVGNTEQNRIRLSLKECSKPEFEVSFTEHKLLTQTFKYPGLLKWKPIQVKLASTLDEKATLDRVLENVMRAGGYQAPSDYKVKKDTLVQTAKSDELYSSTVVYANKQKTVTVADKTINYNIDELEETSGNHQQISKDNSSTEAIIRQYDHNGFQIQSWSLYNCFISSISYGKLSYGSEEIVEISITLQYDWALEREVSYYNEIEKIYNEKLVEEMAQKTLQQEETKAAKEIINEIRLDDLKRRMEESEKQSAIIEKQVQELKPKPESRAEEPTKQVTASPPAVKTEQTQPEPVPQVPASIPATVIEQPPVAATSVPPATDSALTVPPSDTKSISVAAPAAVETKPSTEQAKTSGIRPSSPLAMTDEELLSQGVNPSPAQANQTTTSSETPPTPPSASRVRETDEVTDDYTLDRMDVRDEQTSASRENSVVENTNTDGEKLNQQTNEQQTSITAPASVDMNTKNKPADSVSYENGKLTISEDKRQEIKQLEEERRNPNTSQKRKQEIDRQQKELLGVDKNTENGGIILGSARTQAVSDLATEATQKRQEQASEEKARADENEYLREDEGGKLKQTASKTEQEVSSTSSQKNVTPSVASQDTTKTTAQPSTQEVKQETVSDKITNARVDYINKIQAEMKASGSDYRTAEAKVASQTAVDPFKVNEGASAEVIEKLGKSKGEVQTSSSSVSSNTTSLGEPSRSSQSVQPGSQTASVDEVSTGEVSTTKPSSKTVTITRTFNAGVSGQTSKTESEVMQQARVDVKGENSKATAYITGRRDLKRDANNRNLVTITYDVEVI